MGEPCKMDADVVTGKCTVLACKNVKTHPSVLWGCALIQLGAVHGKAHVLWSVLPVASGAQMTATSSSRKHGRCGRGAHTVHRRHGMLINRQHAIVVLGSHSQRLHRIIYEGALALGTQTALAGWDTGACPRRALYHGREPPMQQRSPANQCCLRPAPNMLSNNGSGGLAGWWRMRSHAPP